MEIWITSDQHFGHANIIKYAKRPFTSVQEMDEYMIKTWNERVRPSDHVYHLGDVTLERGSKNGRQAQDLVRLIKGLNGHKRLLLGNHDHFPIQTYLDAGFEKIHGTWRDKDIGNILFSHIPVHPSSIGSAKANVHGHIHDQNSPKPVIFKGYDTVWNTDSSKEKGRITPYVNVCVEKTAYGPITLSEVNRLIQEEVERAKDDNRVG